MGGGHVIGGCECRPTEAPGLWTRGKDHNPETFGKKYQQNWGTVIS